MTESSDAAAYRRANGGAEPSRANGEPGTAGSAPRTATTLLNGAIGGVTGVLLSFLPLSTVLGGAAAGYLEGGDYADGARVGAVAGAVALVPVALAGLLVLLLPVAPPVPELATGTIVALLLGLGAFYVFGLSVLGGVLGSYVRRELAG